MDSFLNTTYALNSSDSKRLQIGIEYIKSKDAFMPVVRLGGSKGGSVVLEESSRTSSKEKIQESIGYLKAFSRSEEHATLAGDGFNIKYEFYYGEKTIEISNPVAESVKKFKSVVVLQVRSVENLVKILPCIDTYMDYLRMILDNFPDFVQFLARKVYKEFQGIEKADDNVYISVRDLQHMEFQIKDEDVEEFIASNKNFSVNELKHIFNPMIILKPDYVCYNVKKIFMYIITNICIKYIFCITIFLCFFLATFQIFPNWQIAFFFRGCVFFVRT